MRRAARHLPSGESHQVNADRPFRGIDHIPVRYGDSGDPILLIRGCRRVFDAGTTGASDHYGLLAELDPGPAA
jgi:endonuclease/exonuclease/phosphatase family metal-dependent hydrolase